MFLCAFIGLDSHSQVNGKDPKRLCKTIYRNESIPGIAVLGNGAFIGLDSHSQVNGKDPKRLCKTIYRNESIPGYISQEKNQQRHHDNSS
jgi:ribosomal protein L39E